MAVLLVTYDLHTPGQNYDEFLKMIKSYDWARLSESSYAIVSTDSPITVHKKLSVYMDPNDTIYIINLKLPYDGFGPEDVNKWLTQRLTF